MAIRTTARAQVHCPSCNGEIKPGATECTACGTPLPASVSAPSTSSERGWGEGPSFKCEGCGAEVVITQTGLKFTCPYCGNERVLEQPAGTGGATDDVRPSHVLAFKVKKADVVARFQGWVASLWFAPNDLGQAAHKDRIRGVYLPFWCYDAHTHTYYRGEYGVDREESYTEEENGRTVTRTRTVTDWYPRWGWSDKDYRNVLVVASQGVDRGLSMQIEPFELAELVQFSTELLTGWEAERYALDHEEAWEKHGTERVTGMELERCSELVRGGANHVRGVSVELHFSKLHSEHLLLPVYVSCFNYHGKTYRFLMNGQTGKVVGERPWSFWKIFFLVVTIVAVIAAIWFFTQGGSTPPPAPPIGPR
jgi:DNA-directed RNA polymerase subunit RPC12/RpoP